MKTINLGRPTGPRLRDLSLSGQQELDDWLTLTLAGVPTYSDIPVRFTRALATLAKRRGIRFQFSSHEAQRECEVPLGRNIPGCVGGSKRKVTVAGRPALQGQSVNPWHNHAWREQEMIP